jgi:hypothetical protein
LSNRLKIGTWTAKTELQGPLMKRTLLDWLWRAAVLAALVWIGASLHQIHEDMLQPADDSQDVTTAPDDSVPSTEIHRQLAQLDQKVDAIMMAMVQLKR